MSTNSTNNIVYLSEDDLQIGMPLPWSIYLRSGELLAPAGFVVNDDASRLRLLEARPVRVSEGARRPDANAVGGKGGGAGDFLPQASDPLKYLKHNAEGTTLTFRLPGDDEPRTAQVEFYGRIPMQSVIVSAPPLRLSMRTWNDFEGMPMAVQVIFGRKLCVFKTALMRYSALPSPHMFLRYPTDAVTKPFRQALRVDAQIPVSVTLEDGATVPAVIINLSGSGCAIATGFVLGAVGTRFKAAFRVKVDGTFHILHVHCQIRSIKGKLSQQMRYGIQFEEDSDTTAMLVIKSFVYEHLAER